MAEVFDDICRYLAGSMPRRRAFKALGGAVAAALGSILLPRQAQARSARNAGVKPDADSCGPNVPLCVPPLHGSNAVCCPDNHPQCCNDTWCCAKDEECCLGQDVTISNGCCAEGTHCCYDQMQNPDCVNLEPGDPFYRLSGGGKYLGDGGAVCLLRCELCGTGPGSSDIIASSDVNGFLNAFCFIDRMEVTVSSMASFQGSLLGGGDLEASASGTALVNGVMTNINFEALTIGGVTSFQISDAASGQLLASGTGEGDRATMSLDILLT
jgi:hypothetical protein